MYTYTHNDKVIFIHILTYVFTVRVCTKYFFTGRGDMITMQAMSWNKRKLLKLGQALVDRYVKV